MNAPIHHRRLSSSVLSSVASCPLHLPPTSVNGKQTSTLSLLVPTPTMQLPHQLFPVTAHLKASEMPPLMLQLTPQPTVSIAKIPGYYPESRFANPKIVGEESFSQAQPYDPSLCAASCSAKHSPECAFFVSYILYENGQNGVFTCTYFTVAYGPEQAIERGQYDEQGNHYTIGHSFGYTVL
jgi:hypothetical protein